MAQKTTYRVPRRRKREGKTNYKKRLALLLSRKPRAVVRKSNNNIVMQIIEYHPEGDRVIAASHSHELKKFGYEGHSANKNAGYLIGYLAGTRAVKNKTKEAVLDIGIVSPVKGSVVFAVLLGALDAGLNIPHSEKILPAKFQELEEVKKKMKSGE